MSRFPRAETLYVGGFQWTASGDFNPLSIRPSFPISGNVNLVFENLFGYNALTGRLDPILAKSYEFSNYALTVEMNTAARWNDGVPLTAEDVVYTFYLHRRYPTNLSSLWRFVDSVYAVGTSVRFVMNRTFFNPPVMRDIIASTQILPKHVFEQMEAEAIRYAETSISEVILERIRQNPMSQNVVSSGPYRLHSYSRNYIALERDPNYWGNAALRGGRLPSPRFIVHPIYESNYDYILAFAAGQLDMSQTFFAQGEEQKDLSYGEQAEFYVPGAITALVVNFGEATANFAPNPVLHFTDFRRALGFAINYEEIRRVALGGNVPEIRPGFIVNEGAEQIYYNAQDAQTYGVFYSPEEARRTLAGAGFSWDEYDMLIAPDGRAVGSISITSPRGWTDWEQAVRIVAENLRAMGIYAQLNLVSPQIYWHNLSMGYFDLIMHTPRPDVSASLPWARFDAMLNSEDYVPLGVATWSNQGRFVNEDVTQLLIKIPPLKGTPLAVSAYRELNQIFMRELPVIPIMYRPRQFYRFSTRYWKNFPTGENASVLPQHLMTGGGIKGLWEIEPQTKGI